MGGPVELVTTTSVPVAYGGGVHDSTEMDYCNPCAWGVIAVMLIGLTVARIKKARGVRGVS